MAKFSRYYAKPSEIKDFVTKLGHEANRMYNVNGKEVGFAVVGTTVQVSYDIIVDGELYAFGNISVRASLDPEERARSDKLYRKLKRRFGKPPTENQ